MLRSLLIKKIILINILVFLFLSSKSQETFEDFLDKKIDTFLSKNNPYSGASLYPNDALQGIMVPSGFGGYGTYFFSSFGGSYPQVYSHKADFVTSAGFGFGDPTKFLSFSACINVLDISKVSNLSYDFSVSRYIGKGTSISVGGIQLFSDPDKTDAPENTYYVSISHAVQALPSKTPGLSKLTFTVGAGNGRFYLKSELDSINGKGKYGTGVFGSISYEVLLRLNVNAEWDGLNLGMSIGSRPFKNPFSIGVGITNLTSYSGDKPYLIFSVGYSLSLNKST